MMRSMILAGFAAVLAAGCAQSQSQSESQSPDGPSTAHVVCQAGDYQNLVGRNRSDIPEAPAGRSFRVACSTCPVTMDYRDNRVTFSFDQATGRIERVSCG